MERLEFGNLEHIKMLRDSERESELLIELREQEEVGSVEIEACAECHYPIEGGGTRYKDEGINIEYLICDECGSLISKRSIK